MTAHQAALTMLTPPQRDGAEQRMLRLVPVPRHIGHVQLISVARLRYRPHTKRTAAWFAEYKTKSEQHLEQYETLRQGEDISGHFENGHPIGSDDARAQQIEHTKHDLQHQGDIKEISRRYQ